MSHKQEAVNSATKLARVAKRKKGYDTRQVDAFLEQAHALYESDDAQLRRSDIQDASFDIVKGGYSIPQVDATLERLERAVTDKQTSFDIAELGRVAWKAQTEALFHQLDQHAARAEGERFAPGEADMPSYDRKQVDRLINAIIDKAEDELQKISSGITDLDNNDTDESLTAQSVANATFTQRKGKRGYDERQVDYFLNACVNLLGSLESYARIADYANQPVPPASQGVSSVHTPLVDNTSNVLIAEDAAMPVAVPPMQERTLATPAIPPASLEPMQPAQSFDELSKAEQAIFTQSEQQPVPAVHTTPSAASIQDLATTQAFNPITDDEPAPVAVKKTPTLSDIAPITPAPRTVLDHEGSAHQKPAIKDNMNAIPSITAISDETTVAVPEQPNNELNSSSLGSLAQSASPSEIATPEVPKLSTVNVPDVPSLHMAREASLPSIPDSLVPQSVASAIEPEPVEPNPSQSEQQPPSFAPEQSANAIPTKTDQGLASDVLEDSSSLRFVHQDGIDVEIPDLSFPTIASEEPFIINDKPNEKQA